MSDSTTHDFRSRIRHALTRDRTGSWSLIFVSIGLLAALGLAALMLQPPGPHRDPNKTIMSWAFVQISMEFKRSVLFGDPVTLKQAVELMISRREDLTELTRISVNPDESLWRAAVDPEAEVMLNQIAMSLPVKQRTDGADHLVIKFDSSHSFAPASDLPAWARGE